MRGIGRVGRRGPKAQKRRKFRRPSDASEGVSKPWRCPASPPDRTAAYFLPDAAQGRSLWVIIIKIWYNFGPASSPSPPLEGIELAVSSCRYRSGRGTVRTRLQEGCEKKRRCAPLIADPEATQLARAQPAHHPAFAHLKAASHLRR